MTSPQHSVATSSASSSCTICGVSKRRSLILHNLRHRAITRRYCTNCLLKTHNGHFCPICYHVYDHAPPPHLRLICIRCPAIAHRSCATEDEGDDDDSSDIEQSFRCPSCADPNYAFFTPRFEGGSERSLRGSIDQSSAEALVAAARIAALSMMKEAAVARVEAQRRALEAAAARNKAREALECLERIISLEEKDRLVAEQELQKRQRRNDGQLCDKYCGRKKYKL